MPSDSERAGILITPLFVECVGGPHEDRGYYPSVGVLIDTDNPQQRDLFWKLRGRFQEKRCDIKPLSERYFLFLIYCNDVCEVAA